MKHNEAVIYLVRSMVCLVYSITSTLTASVSKQMCIPDTLNWKCWILKPRFLKLVLWNAISAVFLTRCIKCMSKFESIHAFLFTSQISQSDWSISANSFKNSCGTKLIHSSSHFPSRINHLRQRASLNSYKFWIIIFKSNVKILVTFIPFFV